MRADDTVRRIARVSGRVQGVGFRVSAAREAQRCGVTGTVRNLLDGTVEADVEGGPDAVQEMLDWLETGPPSARVTGVQVRPAQPRGAGSFQVS